MNKAHVQQIGFRPELVEHIKKLASIFSELMPHLLPEERLTVINLALGDYCYHCGWEEPDDSWCRCRDDS